MAPRDRRRRPAGAALAYLLARRGIDVTPARSARPLPRTRAAAVASRIVAGSLRLDPPDRLIRIRQAHSRRLILTSPRTRRRSRFIVLASTKTLAGLQFAKFKPSFESMALCTRNRRDYSFSSSSSAFAFFRSRVSKPSLNQP